MTKLEYVPKYSERYEYYGNPDADGDFSWDTKWWDENMQRRDLPFPLIPSWHRGNLIYRLWMNKKIWPALLDAFIEIRSAFKDTRCHGEWNILGDAASIRPMKAHPDLSTHAFGIAIDLNNHKACWQCNPETQHPFIVEAFKERGFVWGGDFPEPYIDPMHFQAVGM